jgi:hypothetical protein
MAALSRWVRFILAIAVGAAVGLLYAWVISPVKVIEATPATLRIDYKTDYVLMVAESYQLDRDLRRAEGQLAFLDDPAPIDLVRQTILFAQRAGYTDADLALMVKLAADLNDPPTAGTTP